MSTIDDVQPAAGPNAPMSNTGAFGGEREKSQENERENSSSKIDTSGRKKKEKIDRSHIRVIAGTPEMYKCDVCEKIFRDKKGKFYHDACITGKKPYTCNICERTFVKRSHFVYHERVHSGYKPFKCSLCERAFPQKNKLNRHMSSHKQEKEHCCNECGKCYSKRDDLSNHTATVHTRISLPYVCKCCDKSFRLLANLNRHARIHSDERPYVCEVCSKSFKDGSLLIRHRKIHGKERPFLCAHCNRHFLSKSELSRHIAIHTDIKPFCCTYCGTIFRRKDNLDRHIRHHHEDNNEQTPSVKQTNNKEEPSSVDVEGETVARSSSASRIPRINNIRGMKKSLKCYSSKLSMVTMEMAAGPAVTMKTPPKQQGQIFISRGNSRDQIISRLDSLGNITPIIRGPGELSNAVPVITTTEDKNGSIQNKKKTFTYTEPIPLAEAVVINRRIEEKLYPQSGSSSNNYYYFRKASSDLTTTTTALTTTTNTGSVALTSGNLLVPIITPMSYIVNNGKPSSIITPVSGHSENRQSYQHSNGNKYVGANDPDDEEKIINESTLAINGNANTNVYHETINTHHWRRRTAESLKSSHRPITE